MRATRQGYVDSTMHNIDANVLAKDKGAFWPDDAHRRKLGPEYPGLPRMDQNHSKVKEQSNLQGHIDEKALGW